MGKNKNSEEMVGFSIRIPKRMRDEMKEVAERLGMGGVSGLIRALWDKQDIYILSQQEKAKINIEVKF